MKKTNLFLALLLASSILFSSCGVIFGGSKYNGIIQVKDHPNAEIYANGQRMGQGEASGLFKRNRPLNIEVREDGCEPQTVVFDNAFRTGNFILSIISWGLIGMGVDLGTGASYKPDHRGNTNITKMSDKNFQFVVDYSRCKK